MFSLLFRDTCTNSGMLNIFSMKFIFLKGFFNLRYYLGEKSINKRILVSCFVLILKLFILYFCKKNQWFKDILSFQKFIHLGL